MKIRYKNLDRTFLRFVTIHAFDGRTPFSSYHQRWHSMQRGKLMYMYLLLLF